MYNESNHSTGDIYLELAKLVVMLSGHLHIDSLKAQMQVF